MPKISELSGTTGANLWLQSYLFQAIILSREMTTRSIDLKRRWQQPQDAASGKWSAEIGQNTNNNHDVLGGGQILGQTFKD